jgi:5-methylthioadenosine/S-adenosylhomocysteine deaminase
MNKPSGVEITADSPSEFIIRSANIMTMDSTIGDIRCGDVHVRGSDIVAVGENINVSGVKEIDAAGKILMPGLIDAHTHLWSSQMRGHFACHADKIYFKTRNRLANGYSAQDMYDGTKFGAAEAIYSGITTVYDFCHNVRNPDFAMRSIEALKETGIRACFQYGASTAAQPTEAIDLGHLSDLARHWSQVAGRAPLTLGLAWRGPLGITTITKDQGGAPLNWRVAESELTLARQQGLPVTIHVSGHAAARQFHALVEYDALGPDIHIAHMTDLVGNELREVGLRGASVVLTPVTELRVGYGMTHIGEFLDAGIKLGIGVDSNALAGNANMFAVLKLFQLIEAGRKKDELAISARKLLELATIDGARALGLEKIVGSITPGKKADLILINPDALNMGLFVDDPAHLIVEAASPENVDTVIVDGNILKSGGKLTRLDAADVIAAAKTSNANIVRRIS